MGIVIGAAAVSQSFVELPDGVTANEIWGARAGLALRLGSLIYAEPGIDFAGTVYTVNATIVENGSMEELEDHLGHAGIRIPLRAGIRIPPNWPVNLRIFAGIAPTFITSTREENDFELEKADYTGTLWAAEIGAGFDLLFLTLSAFYETGLTNIFTDEVPVLQSADVRLDGIGGSFGLRFRI